MVGGDGVVVVSEMNPSLTVEDEGGEEEEEGLEGANRGTFLL